MQDTCPICKQNLNDGCCAHWVASVADDGDGFDAPTIPLYYGWEEHFSNVHYEMISSLETYLEELCSLCKHAAKKGAKEIARISKESGQFPSNERKILNDAIQFLSSPNSSVEKLVHGGQVYGFLFSTQSMHQMIDWGQVYVC